MTFRQKAGLFIMLRSQMLFGHLTVWVIGKDGLTSEVIAGILGPANAMVGPGLRERAASRGLVRDLDKLTGLLAEANASLTPGNTWVFHRESFGKYEGVVLPRVIDSNTVVVMSSEDPGVRAGDIVTVDGLPPNCEPQAMQQFLLPPGSYQGEPARPPAPQEGAAS